MIYAPAPVQRLFPTRTWAREALVVMGAVIGLALLAQLAIPMGPVPITGQTLGVLLVGGLLGCRRGVLAVPFYLGVGTLGAPVFALGMAGPQVLLGPTGGYLIGFLLAAGAVGLAGEHGFLRHFASRVVAMGIATALIFAIGLAWLAPFVPAGTLLGYGFWPFLPGALIKSGLAALLLPSALSRSRAGADS